jgi:hypothetical protein
LFSFFFQSFGSIATNDRQGQVKDKERERGEKYLFAKDQKAEIEREKVTKTRTALT